MNTDIHNFEHPFVCTDAVVFRIQEQDTHNYRKLAQPKLQVLLYKRPVKPSKGKWCLPGGFLNIDETAKECIEHKLYEKTKIESCYLEQLYTFADDLDRDERGRVIPIVYLGLISGEPKVSGEWFTVADYGPKLTFYRGSESLTESDIGFDHYHFIQKALERLRSKLSYTDIVFNLLPAEFTLTQMQNVYEAITGKEEQAANFRRKIAAMVTETDRYTEDMGHRPAKIFVKK